MGKEVFRTNRTGYTLTGWARTGLRRPKPPKTAQAVAVQPVDEQPFVNGLRLPKPPKTAPVQPVAEPPFVNGLRLPKPPKARLGGV